MVGVEEDRAVSGTDRERSDRVDIGFDLILAAPIRELQVRIRVMPTRDDEAWMRIV